MFIIQNKIDCEISFLQHQSLQVRKFFQSAGKCTDASGQIQWRKVKGGLQETLSTVECNRQMTAIRGKFHPLSVWEKKGYDVAEIEKKVRRGKVTCHLSHLGIPLFLQICLLSFKPRDASSLLTHFCAFEPI